MGCYGTVRNNNSHSETNEKGSGESDHTPITYLLSTSLASCNLKNGFWRFVPHIICNNQFSTPEKENAHHHSLQSFAPIHLYRSLVRGIVKKRALNQNKKYKYNAYRNSGNCPYCQNFGAPEFGGPRLKPF